MGTLSTPPPRYTFPSFLPSFFYWGDPLGLREAFLSANPGLKYDVNRNGKAIITDISTKYFQSCSIPLFPRIGVGADWTLVP